MPERRVDIRLLGHADQVEEPERRVREATDARGEEHYRHVRPDAGDAFDLRRLHHGDAAGGRTASARASPRAPSRGTRGRAQRHHDRDQRLARGDDLARPLGVHVQLAVARPPCPVVSAGDTSVSAQRCGRDRVGRRCRFMSGVGATGSSPVPPTNKRPANAGLLFARTATETPRDSAVATKWQRTCP